MNIFVSDNIKVQLSDSLYSAASESLDGDHMVKLPQEQHDQKHSKKRKETNRTIDIYFSLFNDLQHKFIIHSHHE